VQSPNEGQAIRREGRDPVGQEDLVVLADRCQVLVGCATSHHRVRRIIPEEKVTFLVSRDQSLSHALQDQLEHGGLRLQIPAREGKILGLPGQFHSQLG
jgi:hypothetical protein